MKILNLIKNSLFGNKEQGVMCSCCGKYTHDFSLSFRYPDCQFDPKNRENDLGDDLCYIKEQDAFFIRAILEIPIIGHNTPFTWGIWVSQSQDNFEYYKKHFRKDISGRVTFGWLSNILPKYDDTYAIKTNVRFIEKSKRPKIEIQECDHQLYYDYINGITMERAEEFMSEYR